MDLLFGQVNFRIHKWVSKFLSHPARPLAHHCNCVNFLNTLTLRAQNLIEIGPVVSQIWPDAFKGRRVYSAKYSQPYAIYLTNDNMCSLKENVAVHCRARESMVFSRQILKCRSQSTSNPIGSKAVTSKTKSAKANASCKGSNFLC